MTTGGGERPDPVHGSEAAWWPTGWSWHDPVPGQHYRTCSYCGSIHPEDLAAEPDWRAEWADMKYGWPHKFYVTLPSRTPEQRFIIGGSTEAPERYAAIGEPYRPPPERHPDQTWVRPSEITGDVITSGWSDLAHFDWVRIGTRPFCYAKFYSTHLTDPAMDAAALDEIQRTAGLRFHFAGGRVRWEPYAESGSEG